MTDHDELLYYLYKDYFSCLKRHDENPLDLSNRRKLDRLVREIKTHKNEMYELEMNLGYEDED